MQEQPSTKTSRKILIYSILTVALSLISYFSGYGMVFRITAAVVSYLSVGLVLSRILFLIYSKKQQPVSIVDHLWTFLALYTLSPISIALMELLVILVKRWTKKQGAAPVLSGTTPMYRLSALLPEVFFTGLAFLCMDIAREHSVWHEFVVRPLPLLLYIAGLAIVVWTIRTSRKSTQQ
jgi:hypothetical protein